MDDFFRISFMNLIAVHKKNEFFYHNLIFIKFSININNRHPFQQTKIIVFLKIQKLINYNNLYYHN